MTPRRRGSLLVSFFLQLVHQILRQLTIRLDHVGDKGKDEKLDADDKENARGEEIVQVRGDFETTAKVMNEKGNESDDANTNEGKTREAKEFHWADIPYGFEDDAGAVVDEAVDTFDDFGFTISKVGDLNRDPEDAQVLTDGIDDRFLSIGKAGRVVQSEERLATVGAEATGQVVGFDIEKRTDERGAETVEKVFDPRNVFGG